MLKECQNPDKSRGLYNEFLRNDLHDDRKVFELLGSKLSVEPTIGLAGLGFSETIRKEVIAKVDNGKLYRIKF